MTCNIEKNKAITNKNLLVTYQGKAFDTHFLDVLHEAENKLEKIEPQVKLRKKIFNILVEVLQNIHHYFEEFNTDDANLPISISIYKDKNDYFICTGNHIQNEKVLSLKLLLDKINALNKEQLVELYREKLISGVSSTGRAGLGILDIKRKAGEKMLYQFELLNKHYSYFSLIIRVSA